ncbi:PRC-barrel domain-containing protein [Clostridium sp. WILCCON 0269]|uniref:PRC-barrel domain-containing protein n=1 Tax=Candidatus Clostridium eludens TaxID=3381663 RepID=A0ABW8SKC8_9CLOT
MYRTRDFIFMDAVNLSGNLLGFVSDIILNFNNKIVQGFVITPNSLFKKNLNVFLEDVVSFASVIVVTDTNRKKFLQFSDIKGMNVVDKKGHLIGIVEDILFHKNTFLIKALILSTGFISNFIDGKKIVLIDNLILGENNLLYRGESDNLKFFNSPHKLFDLEEDENYKI